jgi:hypothetical protein
MDTLMGRTELVLCLTALLLALGCAPRKYQRVQVVNLHLHNNAGEVPIADVYLTIRSDRVVYVGDCGDLKRVKTVPKEWTPGNNIEVSFKKITILCPEFKRQGFRL